MDITPTWTVLAEYFLKQEMIVCHDDKVKNFLLDMAAKLDWAVARAKSQRDQGEAKSLDAVEDFNREQKVFDKLEPYWKDGVTYEQAVSAYLADHPEESPADDL